MGMGKATDKMWVDVPGDGPLIENVHSFYHGRLTSGATVEALAEPILATLNIALNGTEAMEVPMYEWCRHTIFDATTDAVYGVGLRQNRPDATA